MANSIITTDGTNGLGPYTLNFTLGILKRAYVTCRVNDEVDGGLNPVYRNITWVTDGIVNIDGALPTVADTVVFTRTIPEDELIHDYDNGAAILEANLDESNLQNIMLIHQFLDGRLTSALNNNLDMGGFKIINLADGVDDTDGATVVQLNDTITAVQADLASATAQANAAGVSAAAALVSENAAAADAIQTALDRIATAADVVLTGLDVIATGNDVTATNADVALTGLDVIAAALSETNAAASAAAALVAKIEWQGTYGAGTAYVLNDAVTYLGSSFINIQAGTGQTPVVGGTAYWDDLANKGDAGIGSGDLLAANNLSDVNSASTSLTNIGGIGAATTDTLTNKTFDANGAGNSLSNVDVADLANGTDGELITWDAAGAPDTVAVGTSGQLLTSNGAGAAPTFQDAGGEEFDTAYNYFDECSISTQGGDFIDVGANTSDTNGVLGASTSGTSTSVSNTNTRYLYLYTGNTASGEARVYLMGPHINTSSPNAVPEFGPSDLSFSVKSVLSTEHLSDGTNGFNVRFGIGETATGINGNPSDAIYFEYEDSENSGKWQCHTVASSTDTNTDSGITFATDTRYELEIRGNAAGTSITFYIDGSLVATNTTNIPTVTTMDHTILQIVKTSGISGRPVYSTLLQCNSMRP